MALDHHVDPHLLGEREVLTDLGEQLLRRAGEIATIGDQSLNRGFTCLQDLPPRCERPLGTAPAAVDSRDEVPVDGTAELIHPDLYLLSPLTPGPCCPPCTGTLPAVCDSSMSKIGYG